MTANDRQRKRRKLMRDRGISTTNRPLSTLNPMDLQGYYGELAVHSALTQFAPFDVWSHFSGGSGDPVAWKDQTGVNPDAKLLFHTRNPDLWFEVKNNSGNYKLSRLMVLRDVVPRFKSVDPDHRADWILLLAHKTIEDDACKALELERINLIEWGTTVNKDNIIEQSQIIAVRILEWIEDEGEET